MHRTDADEVLTGRQSQPLKGRKDGVDNRFWGCLRSPRAEHYSDVGEDDVNWGRTSAALFPNRVIFFCWLAHRMRGGVATNEPTFSFRDVAWSRKTGIHFITSYCCLHTICSKPPLPILISTSCQVANTMSLICCALHSITPFSPRSQEQTVA